MNETALALLALVVALGLIVFESRRQQKKYGAGSRSEQGAALMRSGMADLQSILEPEKKVEVLRFEEKDEFLEHLESAPHPGDVPGHGQPEVDPRDQNVQ